MNPLISAEIQHYYGFLFHKGYGIQESSIPFWDTRSWHVVFESGECLIELRYDSGEAFLILSPRLSPLFRCDIRAMIYYLGREGQVPAIIRPQDEGFYRSRRKQLEWLSYLLRSYIDKITPYLTREFSDHKDEILVAMKEYDLIYARRLE